MKKLVEYQPIYHGDAAKMMVDLEQGTKFHLIPAPIAAAHDAVVEAADIVQHNYKAHNHQNGEDVCLACDANIQRLRDALAALNQARGVE